MRTLESLVLDWEMYHRRAAVATCIRHTGAVIVVTGLVIESRGPAAALSELCLIELADGVELPAMVVGFREERVLLMPLAEVTGLRPGARVVATGRPPQVGVSLHMLGRVLDALGRPVDDGPPLPWSERRDVVSTPPPAARRARIREVVATGVRAIDALNTLGKGQRMGIFSGSGIGKSTLLGMVARNTSAEVNVIGLIGERGREVREFLERDLGEEGLARSVVVVSTSDAPALQRIQGAYLAMSIAEYFRDQGKDVMLLFDSVTRFATALREVGLAIGEPPATRGYTPSVFATLPRFLERAGTNDGPGSITGLFTILVEADDVNEPVGDAVRAILDGHIVLSRELAMRNHYPAVDVLASLSRVMGDVVSPEQLAAAQAVRRVLAVYRDAQDLISIGAYQRGANAEIDAAVAKLPRINQFLMQEQFEKAEYEQTLQALLALG